MFSSIIRRFFRILTLLLKGGAYGREKYGEKVAQISNMNVMILFVLIAFIALSVGLAFFFLVPGSVGYGIGIAMFVVAGLLFLIGEINYFVKWKRIGMQY